MIKYGLKIWTTNKPYFEEASRLFKAGKVDFAELYIVPDSFELEELKVLKEMPIVIHSTHFEHNFNVFGLNSEKIKLFKTQVVKTADFLKSQFIILHPGIGDSQEIFKKKVKGIYDKRILIENMPKIAFGGEVCFGHSAEQLNFIRKCGFDICFDFAHAIPSAFSQNLNYKDFIKPLIETLQPFYFHISGGWRNSQEDEHLNLFEGDFDLNWIKKALTDLAQDKEIYLVFEVPKNKNNLENDIKNINYFKNL